MLKGISLMGTGDQAPWPGAGLWAGPSRSPLAPGPVNRAHGHLFTLHRGPSFVLKDGSSRSGCAEAFGHPGAICP